LRKEIQKAIFINEGIVGSGRFGNVLKIKISSNPNYLAFKHQDIFRDKDKRNEIKVYQLLQTAGVTCIPKFVFGGVVYCIVT